MLMIRRWPLWIAGAAIALAACAADGSSGSSSSSNSTSSETNGGGETNGEGAGSGGELPPVVPFQDFASASVALHDDIGLYISVSDVPGGAGCALATSFDAAPPADGKQVMVRIANGGGAEGVYPIAKDCEDQGFEVYDKACAQYREWSAGALTGGATAVSGSVSVTYEFNGGDGSRFIVELALGFGGGVTYTKTFAVLEGSSPMCDEVTP